MKTIRSRVIALVGLGAIGLVIMSVISFVTAQGLVRAASRLSDVNLASIASIDQINRILARQGALLNQAPAQLQAARIDKDSAEFTNLVANLQVELQKLAALMPESGTATDLTTLTAGLPDFTRESLAIFKLAGSFQQQDAVEALNAKVLPLYDKMILATQSLMSRTLQLTKQEPARLMGMARGSANWGIAIAAALLVFVPLASAWMIKRGINAPLLKMSDRLSAASTLAASAASQVTSSSQCLAKGASKQAASLEETSASLEEMSSMTRRNAENAQQASQLAKQTRQAADRGATDMQSMATAMAAIKVSSDDIGKIIKTIDEIAFQTNILALNAAVEAARAGEAGMGFAVVADEVRNLAQRSAQAAKDTAAKIEGAINKTNQGVEINAQVADALNNIVAKARQVDELIAEIANASQEQSRGINQVNTAVGQMDRVTQSNAANAEESAAAAQELNAQSDILKNAVTELLQLVGGSSQSAELRQIPSQPIPRVPRPLAQTQTLIAANGNGHSRSTKPQTPPTVGASRQSENTLEDEFKRL